MAVIDAAQSSSSPLSATDMQRREGHHRKASAQTIYNAIYEAVLTQRLPPGAKLPELELAELFGVSRSIVRKSLTQLASDHVVEQRHNQIATVVKPSVHETREIFEARRAVEGELFRLVSGRLGQAQIAELRRLAREEREVHQQGNQQSRTQHAMRLHLLIADLCPNRVLGAIQRDLVLRSSIAISLYKSKDAGSCFLGDDHMRMVDLLEKNAGDEAALLARQHLDSMLGMLDLDDRESDIDLARILQVQNH